MESFVVEKSEFTCKSKVLALCPFATVMPDSTSISMKDDIRFSCIRTLSWVYFDIPNRPRRCFTPLPHPHPLQIPIKLLVQFKMIMCCYLIIHHHTLPTSPHNIIPQRPCIYLNNLTLRFYIKPIQYPQPHYPTEHSCKYQILLLRYHCNTISKSQYDVLIN